MEFTKHCFAFGLFFLPFVVFSQTIINGSVKNKDGTALSANITVQAKGQNTISGFAVTDEHGNFVLKYGGNADSITITATGIAIGKHSKSVVNRSGRVDFVVEEKPLQLKEVQVNIKPIRRHGDTLNYIVDAYTDQNDRVIGDVLKKMPGIEVSASGAITYNGRAINKFYVENMDLLHGRYGIATNNISAKDVATVQVLENHQPIKALRDRSFSDRAAINLKLKEKAKGTLAVTGMAALGYAPVLWGAELVAMYFGKKQQDMSAYKGNDFGDDVSREFRTHYDYERVLIGVGSPLYVQSPGDPPVAQKRYLYNNSHAFTVNHLIKPKKEDMEFTANVQYYNDCIEREGYSLYEQFLPGDSLLSIEERIAATSRIHNLEAAIRLNINASDYYLNNALNIRGSLNSDFGAGLTRSNAGNLNETISQHLDMPAYAIDNTLNIIRNIKNNSFNVHFSTGYGFRPHSLTVTPANYLGDNLSSLTQTAVLRDFASVLRLSYGLKLGAFNLNYNVFGRAELNGSDTELAVENPAGERLATPDSLKNNLLYGNYTAGFDQSYTYRTQKLRISLGMPLTYTIFTKDDRIPEKFVRYNKFIFNPSLGFSYDLTPEFQISAGGNFGNSFNLNSSYTGFIMHGYRSLMRNTVDRLSETRTGGANAGIAYRNAFNALFLNLGVNYGRSWRNMLYGYNYRGIMSVRTIDDRPALSDNYGIRFSGSKGLGFWGGTVRLSGSYGEGSGKQLIQEEILNYRSQNYSAGGSINLSPFSVVGLKYSISWHQNKNFVVERPERFPPIRGVSQSGNIGIFVTKSLTINLNAEHQYNSAAHKPYTSFADAGVKYRHKGIDMEIEINNIFDSKQYISASYSEISTHYAAYGLRPLSVLGKIRFKLK